MGLHRPEPKALAVTLRAFRLFQWGTPPIPPPIKENESPSTELNIKLERKIRIEL